MSLNSHRTRNFNKQKETEEPANTLIKLWAECSGGMIHSRGRKFFSSKNIHTGSEAHSALYPEGSRDYFPRYHAAGIWL